MSQSRQQISPSAIRPNQNDGVTDLYGQSQAEVPFDLLAIGATLRANREGRGIPVVKAAQDLFIKKSTLNAIESGQWASLPHPVYVKGYVKSYASYLGILDVVESRFSGQAGNLETPGARRLACPRVLEGKGGRESPIQSRRLFLPRIVLVCSSVAGALLALAVSSGMQTATIVTLKDLFVGCHLAIADLRRFILP